MPFEPHTGVHAIQEVVFSFAFQRVFTPEEVELVIAAHGLWKDDLPGMFREVIPPFFANAGQGIGQLLGSNALGVRFDRFRNDGSLEWRMAVQFNQITVNCLSYTRWDDVSKRALGYLAAAQNAMQSIDNSVTMVGLQCLDSFNWVGNSADYDARLLFSDQSDAFSPIFWTKVTGPLWHLHQGWFEPSNNSGRLLNRFHIDAVETESKNYKVVIDHTQLNQIDSSHSNSIGTDQIVTLEIFEEMHKNNKELMISLLTNQVAARIKLNA